MADLHSATTCGCGKPLTRFKSGRFAKTCGTHRPDKSHRVRLHRQCKRCEITYIPRPTDSMFCATCRDLRRQEKIARPPKTRICPSCGGKKDKSSKHCSPCSGIAVRTRKHDGVCLTCGDKFTRRPHDGDRMLYCSRECAFAQKRIGRQARESARMRKIIARLSKDGPHRKVWFRECSSCAHKYVATRLRQDTCATCYATPAQPLAQRSCASCGALFNPRLLTHLYCSARCRPDNGLRKFKQRAAHYGVSYEPVNELRVFERDGWQCQICGKHTPRAKRGKHRPNSPELDHRIAMANGGAHSYANTQCSCRACNGEKGSGRAVGQLPLFSVESSISY